MYTEQQLREKLVAMVSDLETNGSTITSATTGSGASYSRRIEASREDLISLYSAALNYKLGYDAQTGFAATVQFNNPFTR